MKIVFAILVLTLVPQNAVASIFDSFKQALSSITESVEKMISTVASDVKETIDCTLLALEHSLSITLFKEYNKKCNGINKSDFIDMEENLTEAVLHTNSEHMQEDSSEFELNAKTKMKRICGIPEDDLDLDKIRIVLLHNSGRLRIMDDFLKKQLALLPRNLDMMDNILSKDTECSVEEVLNKIKALIDTVKKVQDQKVGDEIEDVLNEMLHLLNGNDQVASSGETHPLHSELSNTADVTKPPNNIVVLQPQIEVDNYFDTTSYEAPLVVGNDQSDPAFEHEDFQDIAEEADTDYVNVSTENNEMDENVQPMSSEVTPNNSDIEDTDDNDDIDSIVKYIMAANDDSSEEDSSEYESVTVQSTSEDVSNFPLFSDFDGFMPSLMNTGPTVESMFPDDDLMRKVTEILRDQPHTELMMGNLRN